MLSLIAPLALLGLAEAAAILPRATVTITVSVSTTSSVPQYFQTTPELFAGPTATGPEPFLAETDTVLQTTGSYVPPHPLQTKEVIPDNPTDGNIFEHMGNLSPYFNSPGFGVDEYPLPEGSEIVWLNMISRHGSRYPTDPIKLGSAIANVSGSAKFTGSISFLNTWKYTEGINILSPWGRQELYDSGVLHNYEYGHLYDPNSGKKIIARSTTMDRMVKSAENFLSGFFGLSWQNNATLELIIDETGFNNSLAGYNACPNNQNVRSAAGANASELWQSIYLKNATDRLNSMSTGFNWTTSYAYDAQQLCAYETVNDGFSKFCDLFTYEEWLYFEQAIDLEFAGTFGFQSPTGRAVGVGYVEEVLARINHHLITTATGSDNVTLDSMKSTFPVYQNLNLDFSHDVNIASVITAFGLKQFAPFFPATSYSPNRSLIVSHMEPFGARLDIEIIDTPKPVCADRSNSGNQYEDGEPKKYIHFILNQRTIPLGKSFPSCGQRADGWCELQTFLKTQADAMQQSDYNFACNGNYTPPKYGEVSNGAPPTS